MSNLWNSNSNGPGDAPPPPKGQATPSPDPAAHSRNAPRTTRGRPAQLDDGSSRSCSPTAALRPLTDLPARGLLSRVLAAAPGAAARIEALGEDSLRLMISEVCSFDEVRLNHKGLDTHRVGSPPREILQSILAMDGLDQRPLPAAGVAGLSPPPGLGRQNHQPRRIPPPRQDFPIAHDRDPAGPEPADPTRR